MGVFSFTIVLLSLFGVCVGFFPTTLRLVDHRNGNLFFRGPEPKKLFGGFSYDSLVESMKLECEKSGVTFPSSFSLIDVCLLTKEKGDIDMEEKYFAANPAKGSFASHPCFGVNITTFEAACLNAGGNRSECSNKDMQPNELSPDVVMQMAKQFPDNLGSRLLNTLKFIGSMMESTKPTIVYAHCICGCDRTGEVAASYSMMFLNQTFTTAMNEDRKVAGRLIGYEHQVSAQWFCEYLVASGQYPHGINDCGNCTQFACHPHKLH